MSPAHRTQPGQGQKVQQKKSICALQKRLKYVKEEQVPVFFCLKQTLNASLSVMFRGCERRYFNLTRENNTLLFPQRRAPDCGALCLRVPDRSVCHRPVGRRFRAGDRQPDQPDE